MKTKGIYIGEIVRFGWKKMKENLGFFIVLLLVAWLIQTVPQFIGSYLIDRQLIFGIIIYLIALVLNIVVAMGLIKVSLRFSANKKGTFGDLFSCFPLFFKYLFGSILYVLIFCAGLILLIFPGIIWGIKFGLFPYFIIDKGLGPIKALKASAKTTMGARWDLLGFGFVVSIISLLGVLCLVIGIFATIPTTMIAAALVYRRLLSQTKKAS
jgi:uncharacterized membrane protein